MKKDDQSLHFVADCPASPGFGGVIVLRTREGAFIYFAPCCGLAWSSIPGQLDLTQTPGELGAEQLSLPSRLDVEEAGIRIIRTEPLENWVDDLPIAAAVP